MRVPSRAMAAIDSERQAAIDDRLQAGLLEWYGVQGRDLPWRRTSDPYAVLVSEVMLQQTQVSRVVPRFEAWLERWPTADDLAAAPAAEVLAEWSGLGYNSRALRLHATAKAVAEQGWPDDEAGLRALPGIGPYTAAAVTAFALRRPAAAVDTNQQRVLDRWDGAAGRTAVEVRRRALEFVPVDAPDAWNHALMDLGATICTARTARCDACPVASDCASAGLVDPAAERALRRASRQAVPFESTPRFVRGRIVAALVEHGEIALPALAAALPAGITAERIDGALSGLVRDGLVVRAGDALTLPT
ncbi:MAG: A/G-specific adenine glycosylase [Solirubrobacteraceae bacterium]|nr:A/G-specific adenine glycosylase [Solirubrobacteraceae bacterium]